MKCIRVTKSSNGPVGCGQCMPCRINRTRVLVLRMMLESLQHPHSSFVTLTYAKEFLPENGDVVKSEVPGFVKRLRAAGHRVRYVGVGEYGGKGFRPHYHLIVFGMEPCRFGRTNHAVAVCCRTCEGVRKAWAKGRIEVGPCDRNTMQYVCGYVTKKMTKRGDPRLEGHAPEFMLYSRRPGIGMGAVPSIVRSFETESVAEHVNAVGDIPTVLRVGGKIWPMGQYLVRRLREEVFGEARAPKNRAKRQEKSRLQAMREDEVLLAALPEFLPFVDRLSIVHQRKAASSLARRSIFQRRQL